MDNRPELIIEIERLRKEMIEQGMETGLSSPSTIEKSQELDELLILSIKGVKSKIRVWSIPSVFN